MVTRRQVCQGLAAPFFAARIVGQPTGTLVYPAAEFLTIAGRSIRSAQPPKPLVHDAEAGLLIAAPGRAQRIHVRATPNDWCGEARCTIAPRGDYLLMFTAGTSHYGGHSEK